MKKYQQGGNMQFSPKYNFPDGIKNPNAMDSTRYAGAFNKAQEVMTGPQRPWVQKKYGNELILRQNAGIGNSISNAAYQDFTQQAMGNGILRPMQRFQQGGSIVDYMKAQGYADTSKAARRKLAQAQGLKGDLSAQDNLALLQQLKTQGQTPSIATSYNANIPQAIQNQMVPVQDVNPETGEPITMMVNSPQLMNLVRPEQIQIGNPTTTSTASSVRSRVRPPARKVAAPVVNDNDIYAAEATKRLKMYADQTPAANAKAMEAISKFKSPLSSQAGQRVQLDANGNTVRPDETPLNWAERASAKYDNNGSFFSTTANVDNPGLVMIDGVLTAGAKIAAPIARTISGKPRGAMDIVSTALAAVPFASQLSPLVSQAKMSPTLISNLQSNAFKVLADKMPKMSNEQLSKIVKLANISKNQKEFAAALAEEAKVLGSTVKNVLPKNTTTYGFSKKISDINNSQKNFAASVAKEAEMLAQAKRLARIRKNLSKFNPNE